MIFLVIPINYSFRCKFMNVYPSTIATTFDGCSCHADGLLVLKLLSLENIQKVAFVTFETGYNFYDIFNALSAKPTKWSNTLKRFAGFWLC